MKALNDNILSRVSQAVVKQLLSFADLPIALSAEGVENAVLVLSDDDDGFEKKLNEALGSKLGQCIIVSLPALTGPPAVTRINGIFHSTYDATIGVSVSTSTVLADEKPMSCAEITSAIRAALHLADISTACPEMRSQLFCTSQPYATKDGSAFVITLQFSFKIKTN